MKRLDAQRMLDTAASFFLAGERCAPDLEFGPYGQHSVTAPRIVTYAFAVEVALKLILHLHAREVGRAHSLKELFHLLPCDARVFLPHLAECVEDISTYFVDWRYAYEKDILFGDFDDPRRAFIECYREVRRLRPDLTSVYEQIWGRFEPDWFYAWPELESRKSRSA